MILPTTIMERNWEKIGSNGLIGDRCPHRRQDYWLEKDPLVIRFPYLLNNCNSVTVHQKRPLLVSWHTWPIMYLNWTLHAISLALWCHATVLETDFGLFDFWIENWYFWHTILGQVNTRCQSFIILMDSPNGEAISFVLLKSRVS